MNLDGRQKSGRLEERTILMGGALQIRQCFRENQANWEFSAALYTKFEIFHLEFCIYLGIRQKESGSPTRKVDYRSL